MCIVSHIPHFSSLCFGSCPVYRYLQSFFYDATCNAASMIDYSKEPLVTNIVVNPLPKIIFHPSLSPSPLKGAARGSPSWFGSNMTLTGI
jgi:hypothetical protein